MNHLDAKGVGCGYLKNMCIEPREYCQEYGYGGDYFCDGSSAVWDAVCHWDDDNCKKGFSCEDITVCCLIV
jgi:hypothetical protein